jgi:nucleotide-binding universal stress UspA family protein
MQKLTTILAVADCNEELPIALDKAIALSRIFGARLELLVAAPHDALIRRLGALRPDLVVKACTASHPLRRWTLGGSDWKLAKECAVPLLLARARPWERPPRFAAAVDISDRDNADVARGILQASGFLALGIPAELDVLYSERESNEERVRMERTVRLAQTVREFHVGCENIRRLEGEPDVTLLPLVIEHRYDMLVLGSPARSESLAGMRPGTASLLIDALDRDVLLVKPESASAPRSAGSLRQHRTDQLQEFA